MGAKSNDRKYMLNICQGLKISIENFRGISCIKHYWQVKEATLLSFLYLPKRQQIASHTLFWCVCVCFVWLVFVCVWFFFFSQRVLRVIRGDSIWLSKLENSWAHGLSLLSSITLYLPKIVPCSHIRSEVIHIKTDMTSRHAVA